MIDWNNNAKSAVQAYDSWLYCNDTGNMIASEALEKFMEDVVFAPQTKNVKDAVEWAGNVWVPEGYDAIAYNPSIGNFSHYKSTEGLNEKWYHVCTREEFEAYVKEQCSHEWLSADNEVVQGASVCTKCKAIVETAAIEQENEKWTHTLHGEKCRIITDEPDADGMLCCLYERGMCYIITQPDNLKPIKPTITKEQPNFKATRENLEKIAKVAQGDFVEVEQENEKWTHTYIGGEECRVLIANPDRFGVIVIYASDNGYMTCEPDDIKPIKPTMTKADEAALVEFMKSSHKLEVINEVRSYIREHDIT